MGSFSLLASRPIPTVLETRQFNSVNGSDAESYAMSQFILACRGEGHWGSREDDNSKIDLILSFEHPWASKERMLILSQVKSGATYGHLLEKGFVLNSAAKKAAKRTTHHICVVWVDRTNRKAFWAYIHPNTTLKNQTYGEYHLITPATRFDLAHCMSMVRAGETGAKGIHVRRRNSLLNNRRAFVKKRYSEQKEITSPVLGKIELTRLGWRHMFRKSRREENKATSLDIIPYLRNLLVRFPSTHAITSSDVRDYGCFTYQRREHLLKFNNLEVTYAKGEGKNKVCAYIRVIEEIRYPKDWTNAVMLSQQVERRVVLKSAYYK